MKTVDLGWHRLRYVTLQLRLSLRETGGAALLRPLALAFWGLRSLRVLRPPRTPRPLFAIDPEKQRIR